MVHVLCRFFGGKCQKDSKDTSVINDMVSFVLYVCVLISYSLHNITSCLSPKNAEERSHKISESINAGLLFALDIN